MADPKEKIKGNGKCQNPNVKWMSKDKVQNIWPWAFGLDLTFGIWSLVASGAAEGG
jgi:hypothetical protein